MAVLEMHNRSNWWRVWLNHKPVSQPILLPASHGRWSPIASMDPGYGPLYFASAVLPDGRVIVEGGEYNFCSAVWTTLGSIYDPVANITAACNYAADKYGSIDNVNGAY